MTSVPNGWAVARVSDLAAPQERAITDGPFGSNLKTAHYTQSGPRVVRLQNIGDMRFINEEAHITEPHFEELRQHAVEADDVLVAGLGEQLPRACLVPASLGPAIVKADCFRIRLHPDMSPGYVCAILNSPQVRATASKRISGVGRPRLNLAKVRDIELPIPPAAEQRRIGAAIDEQLSRLESGVTLLHTARQKLERLRASVLQAAVMGRLPGSLHSSAERFHLPAGHRSAMDALTGHNATKVARAKTDLLTKTWQIPNNWTWLSMAEVCEVVTNGDTPAPESMTPGDGDVPFIKVYNLTAWGDLDFSVRPTFVTHRVHDGELKRSRLLPGDILTNIVGPPLGKVAVVPATFTEWNTNQAVVVFRPISALHPFLLKYWLLSPPVLELLKSTSRATAGQFNISLTTCRALPVPIPPRTEQETIVAAVEEQLSLVDSAGAVVRSAEDRSASLRAAVLNAAFLGDLTRQDPSDEPASTLLDRIARAQRSTTVRKPKRGTRGVAA